MLILSAVCLAAAWAVYCICAGQGPWAPVFALVLVTSYLAVIALEFVLMAHIARRQAGSVRPSVATCLLAFAGEIRASLWVFLWAQPFCAARWPDSLPPTSNGRRGVLLVHGYFCNRGFWNDWLRRLHAQQTPVVAVTLEPIFGSISACAPTIGAAIARLQAATGMPPVVVAHSMGGLAVRHWWCEQARGDCSPSEQHIHHLLTLGTPHAGTWLAHLGLTTNARQMRIQSPWLTALAHREPPEHRPKMTCYFSDCDNIVFPAEQA